MAQKKTGGRASKYLKQMRGGSMSTSAPREGAEAGVKADDPAPGFTGATHGRAIVRERPVKPVRITVDLDAERHRFLREYAYRQDAKGTEVVRVLLDELRDAPELSERVARRLLPEVGR